MDAWKCRCVAIRLVKELQVGLRVLLRRFLVGLCDLIGVWGVEENVYDGFCVVRKKARSTRGTLESEGVIDDSHHLQ